MGIFSYAQNFEDVILWRALGHVTGGRYIDIGAQDPNIDSVSRVFYDHGWRGIHVEPMPHYADLLRQNRPDETVVQAVVSHQHGVVSFYGIEGTGMSTALKDIAEDHHENLGFPVVEIVAPTVTLDDVLALSPPGDIHWLKIDVEGFEREVLSGWGSPQRPWVIVVEAIKPMTRLDTSENWESLIIEKDYTFVFHDGLNRYYLSNHHHELLDEFKFPANVFDDFQISECSATHTGYLLNKMSGEAASWAAQLAGSQAEAAERLASSQAEAAERERRLSEQNAITIDDWSARLAASQAEAAEHERLAREHHALSMAITEKNFSEIRQAWESERTALNALAARLDAEVSHLAAYNHSMVNSWSWRITQPLRWFKKSNSFLIRSTTHNAATEVISAGSPGESPMTLDELLVLPADAFISAAYSTILGRNADPMGVKYYLKRLADGYGRTSVLADLVNSKEGQARRTYEDLMEVPANAFVAAAYRRVLGRGVGGDPGGKDHYENALQKHGNRRRIIRDLEKSTEAKKNKTRQLLADIDKLLAQAKRQKGFIGWFSGGGRLERQFNRLDEKISDVRLALHDPRDYSKNPRQHESKKNIAASAPRHPSVTMTSGHGLSMNSDYSLQKKLVKSPSTGQKIYFFVDHTIKCPANTGLQRVVRQLSRALLTKTNDLVFVKWSSDLNNFILVDKTDLDHLSQWNGPELSSEILDFYPLDSHAPSPLFLEGQQERGWLFFPEVTHITDHEQPVTLSAMAAAQRAGLKTAFVYYDAIPLRLPEYKDSAHKHEMYMQHLLLADLVIPISYRSGREIADFFVFHQKLGASYPTIHSIPLSGEIQLTERCLEPADPQQQEKIILCVGSIEPRKNQIALLEAFERYCLKNPDTQWRLVLVGHVHGQLVQPLASALARNARVIHRNDISDTELDQLYTSAAFTAFPSVEEGFGLPILESLWYAKPCICADFGTMAEVSLGGGCYQIDTTDVGQLHDALATLIDDAALRYRLSKEACRHVIPSWDDYSHDVLHLLEHEGNPLNTLDKIYYWVDHTGQFPDNSAIQRSVRQLARAALDMGVALIPVKWDVAEQKLCPASPKDLEHLEATHGPLSGQWGQWVAPAQGSGQPWLLIPELVYQPLAEVRQYAASVGLRCAAIFYDAMPSMIGETGPAAAGAAHGHYMDIISGFEAVFPISRFSLEALVEHCLTTRVANPSLEKRLHSCVLPTAITQSDKVTHLKASNDGVVRVLSIAHQGLGKSALAMLDAFAMAQQKSPITLELTMVGPWRAEFASEQSVKQKIAEAVGVTWEDSVDEGRLAALYEACDFTIDPTSGEDFGHSIIESLWKARPCLCDNHAAMAEVAQGGGCLTVDVTDSEAFATAIATLAEDAALRTGLAEAAIKRPIKTWGNYAEEVLLAMASERPRIRKPLRGTISDEVKFYSEMVNIQPRPLLSICISTYNRADWIAVGLKNLVAMIPVPRADVEILICDNTSTDHTPEVVQPYVGRSDFTYIRNEKNVGMLGNLRVTSQNARGQYIWVLGDDDLPFPESIDNIINCINTDPNLAMVYLNYSYTFEKDAKSVTDIDAFLKVSNKLIEDTPNMFGKLKDICTFNENLFTGIYCMVFRRDHALRVYSQDTSGRIFSTMKNCIPTTYYVLNHMMEENAAWLGASQLVVNFNVSWNDYATLFILERFPEARDLAVKMGANHQSIDAWRRSHYANWVQFFEQILENDQFGNGAFFSPARLIASNKHLDGFDEVAEKLRMIYETAYEGHHPAATMPPEKLFAAFDAHR